MKRRWVMVLIGLILLVGFVALLGTRKENPVRLAASQREGLQELAYVAGSPSDASKVQAASPAADEKAVTRKIIRNGEITIVVKSYDRFFEAMQKQIEQHHGYISQIQVTRSDNGVSSALVTLRILPGDLNSMVWWLREQGTLASERIQAEDISEQYYDLKARLENAQRFEARLQDMLKNQTGNLKDVMLVEEQLNQVREQIEEFQGKIRYYDVLVDLATLTIHVDVQAQAVVTKAPTFFEKASRAFRHSVSSLVECSEWVGIAITALIPWMLPLLLFFLLARYTLRYFRRVRA
jgi:Domain of unknown function (DUF4349)